MSTSKLTDEEIQEMYDVVSIIVSQIGYFMMNLHGWKCGFSPQKNKELDQYRIEQGLEPLE